MKLKISWNKIHIALGPHWAPHYYSCCKLTSQWQFSFYLKAELPLVERFATLLSHSRNTDSGVTISHYTTSMYYIFPIKLNSQWEWDERICPRKSCFELYLPWIVNWNSHRNLWNLSVNGTIDTPEDFPYKKVNGTWQVVLVSKLMAVIMCCTQNGTGTSLQPSHGSTHVLLHIGWQYCRHNEDQFIYFFFIWGWMN